MILAVTLNPCVDRTIFVKKIELGKITQGTRSTCVAGGKGLNVARLVRRLGMKADSFTVLGGIPGQLVADLSRTRDRIEQIAVWTAAPTRDIVTVAEEETCVQAAFKEPSPQITPAEKRQIIETFQSIADRYSLIALMGSSPCGETDDVYRRMVEIAKARGKRTILDSSGIALTLGIEAAPSMVKPNLAETAAILGRALTTDSDVWEAVEFYRGKGTGLVVLTDGERGAYVQRDGRRWRALPPKVKTVNPVASGDSLVAGFAIGMIRNLPTEEMIRLGVACGAANATMWEPSSFGMETVEKLVREVQVIEQPCGPEGR